MHLKDVQILKILPNEEKYLFATDYDQKYWKQKRGYETGDAIGFNEVTFRRKEPEVISGNRLLNEFHPTADKKS